MKDLFKHHGEFLRALANHKYEMTDNGVYFTQQHALVGGSIIHTVNGQDMRVDHNTFTIEGLNYLFSSGMRGGTAYSTYYVAPFSGNVTPASTLTAATFTSTLTEATAYSEAARPAYTIAAPASGAVTNSASRAEITANASVNIWGAGILSASAKSATTGVCIAAAKFASVRALDSTDVLAFEYGLTLTPA